MSDIQILQFRIPDNSHIRSAQGNPPQPATADKTGTYEWKCQLSLLDDASTVRATLGPVPRSTYSHALLDLCCSLQVIASAESDSNTAHILLSRRIKEKDLFKRGVEFYMDHQDIWINHHYEFSVILSSLPVKLLGLPDGPSWTHSLALSECDPIARNVDPLVEMLTRFERDALTADVDCRFLSSTGQIIHQLRAHRAILSIYPVFSEKIVRSPLSPRCQRSVFSALDYPLEARASFERLLGFIYSGKLPREPFVPRSDEWRLTFDLTKEYGLDKSSSAEPWMDWHLEALQEAITDEDVLEIYFGWGYLHRRVSRMCVQHVAERSQIQFREKDLGTYVMEQLRDRYRGQQGCSEFQEALVILSMSMYANQQQEEQEQQQQQQQRRRQQQKYSTSNPAELGLPSHQ
ncbi:hypothetical protein BGX28_005973 [Mortierella sp. GBA30]|nr:hypothetical protein BGX28_005973 [Mortierella sp. GBA30]